MLPEAQNCVHSYFLKDDFLKDDFILKNLVNYGGMFDIVMVSVINRQRMTVHIINMAHNAIPMIAFPMRLIYWFTLRKMCYPRRFGQLVGVAHTGIRMHS